MTPLNVRIGFELGKLCLYNTENTKYKWVVYFKYLMLLWALPQPKRIKWFLQIRKKTPIVTAYSLSHLNQAMVL